MEDILSLLGAQERDRAKDNQNVETPEAEGKEQRGRGRRGREANEAPGPGSRGIHPPGTAGGSASKDEDAALQGARKGLRAWAMGLPLSREECSAADGTSAEGGGAPAGAVSRPPGGEAGLPLGARGVGDSWRLLRRALGLGNPPDLAHESA